MTPDDLMEAARAQAEPGHGRATQAQLRRAIGTAYYAMFHALAAAVADLIVGERNPEWHRACRSLEHGRARNACQQVRTMGKFPADIREFARMFVEAQTERQQADYALDRKAYKASGVLGHIVSAEEAIALFQRADSQARRNFVARVLFKQRA